MRQSIAEIKRRTYKERDSWWTVLLVDPLAVRMVWLAAPYRWITPNVITAVAFLFGLGAVACFATGERGLLALGALLFYVSFAIDCVDGKIARLNGTGSFFGAWLDFLVDRVRFIAAAAALFAGQYAATHRTVFLVLGGIVLLLDLLHYVNGAEINQVNASMRAKLDAAGAAAPSPGAQSMTALAEQTSGMRRFRSFGGLLQRFRIRPRVFSGIELEQFICVLAPLAAAAFGSPDAIVAVTVFSIVMHLAFEAAVIALLFRSTRGVTRRLRARNG